ncbi:MAG: efflux RND transporter permease subunit [Alistipes indistinctus]
MAGVDVAIPLTAPGRLSSVSDFEEIVVRANPDGSFIRMRDVARVSLEASSYSTESGLNGSNAAILGIYMLPGANAMQVATEVKEAMKEIAKDFPEGLDYLVPFDMTEYIAESIHEVYKTLFEALFLVILVVFLSLQSWRTALIPIVAVPISLVGTFGFMLIMGFSLNMLTLLGLVLAIGIVVDDAIVVVENVERIMEQRKIGAREATHIAMKELTGALIATSLVLAAVFIPVSFLAGITGSLFRQFSVTIVVSVLISAVVALTLSPAMCAIILRPQTGRKNIVFRKINIWLNRGNKKYTTSVRRGAEPSAPDHGRFRDGARLDFRTQQIYSFGFHSAGRSGFFTVELAMPEGTTIERTREVTERAIAYLGGHDAVEYVQNVTGSSPRVGTNQGRATLTVILKPWKERDKKVEEVMRDVQREFHDYPEISAFTTRPPVVPGLGSAGGVEFQLQARSGAEWDDLVAAVDTFRRYAAETSNWPLSPRRCSRRFRSFTSMWTAIRRSCSESRCPTFSRR